MRVFLDTSTLFKKYVEETGSLELEKVLNRTLEIVVSPVTFLELNVILERRLKEKSLDSAQVEWVRKEARIDFQYFHSVIWNEALEQKALELVQKFPLKTLDSIQLAASRLADASLFLTSDRKLFSIASRLDRHVRYI